MISSRLEYKYLLPRELCNEVRARMLPFVERDAYADAQDVKEYTVRSIYYDTHKMQFYEEKIEGIKVRKKLRIRCYNEAQEDSRAFLEIKRKYANYISKNRASLQYEDVADLLTSGNIEKYIDDSDPQGREMDDARRFFYHLRRRSLRPTVLVVYDREAYFSKFNSKLRITIDKNLRSAENPSIDGLFNNEVLQPAMPKHFILEVKFYNGLPSWLQSMIKSFRLKRMALSKYAICVDSRRSADSLMRSSVFRNGSAPFADTLPDEEAHR